MKRNQLNKQTGFTLIEVMVVIVILGVLAALIVPNVMGRGEKAKVDTTVIKLQSIAGSYLLCAFDRFCRVPDSFCHLRW